MIRQRPFNVLPGSDDIPRDIFISTFDTAPLAPNLNFVVEGKEVPRFAYVEESMGSGPIDPAS